MRHVFQVFVLVAVLLAPGARPSFGQSAYVSAAVVGDVLLNTHSETSLGRDVPSGGEAVGFALRVGTPLGSRWGVELEFTRAGEIETEFDGAIPLASRATSITWSSVSPGSDAALVSLLQRPVSYSLRASQRHSTLSTTLWMNQELSERVSLVYLAGMAFNRSTFESESRFEILPLPPGFPLPPGITIPGILPTTTKTVMYGVRPLAGIEGRIGLTEQVDLVPGLRLHGIDNGWLLRPAVGLAWNF
jgi:hypothetical protein